MVELIVMDTLLLLSSSDGECIIVSLVPIIHHWSSLAGYEMEDVADNVGDVSLEDIIASVELVGNEDC
ncbi:hypothetical protein Tco_0702988 [Tanacetum coccineum]|uniref:Uncharacterized protein n=1 Tax=Tanacetum coccineum TaxID=301880 RepID=A0ABQ4XYW6_9ASTR